jgi:hypothetical protein
MGAIAVTKKIRLTKHFIKSIGRSTKYYLMVLVLKNNPLAHVRQLGL